MTKRGRWSRDFGTGLVNAIVSVPDGLASAALAGVNPIAGLYASAVAPIAGSSLFFAGARSLAERLPRPEGEVRPVVILRLRGHSQIGATLVDVLDDYADLLASAGEQIYLAGIEPCLLARLGKVSKLQDGNDPRLYEATERLSYSTRRAVEDVKAWRYAGAEIQKMDFDPNPPDAGASPSRSSAFESGTAISTIRRKSWHAAQRIISAPMSC